MTGADSSVHDAIGGNRLLVGASDATIAVMAGCAAPVTFADGHLIMSEGQPADTLYLVQRGQVSLEVHAPGQGTLVIETVGPGHVVGWSWMFPPYRWSVDARASGEVEAIAVDGPCLRAKVEADPVFGLELARRIGAEMLERLQGTRLRLLDLYGRAH